MRTDRHAACSCFLMPSKGILRKATPRNDTPPVSPSKHYPSGGVAPWVSLRSAFMNTITDTTFACAVGFAGAVLPAAATLWPCDMNPLPEGAPTMTRLIVTVVMAIVLTILPAIASVVRRR